MWVKADLPAPRVFKHSSTHLSTRDLEYVPGNPQNCFIRRDKEGDYVDFFIRRLRSVRLRAGEVKILTPGVKMHKARRKGMEL